MDFGIGGINTQWEIISDGLKHSPLKGYPERNGKKKKPKNKYFQ